MTLIVRDFTEVDASSHSGSDTLIGVAPRFVIATAALIAIAYVRGEKPRWRWGKD